MKFVLRVESPLHVGNGEGAVLTWLDYHLEGRTIHVLDWPRILDAASEGAAAGPAGSAGPAGASEAAAPFDVVERFAAWSDEAAKIVDTAAEAALKAISRERAEILRRSRDESSPVRFARQALSNDALAKRIRDGEFDRYSAEFSGGRLDRRLEIRTTAKGPDGKPVVPATTLRGQIRSALLHAALSAGGAPVADRVMGGSAGADGWRRSLADATPGRSRFHFGDALERALLRPASRMDDPRFDLMRFLRVSECTRSRTRLVVVRASPFFIRKDKVNPLAPVVAEAIDAGSELEFELHADAALLRGAALANGGTHALVHDEFWSQFARVFGVTREDAKTLEPKALEERMLAAVEVALGSRHSATVRRENQWFEWAGAPKEAPLRFFFDGLGATEGRIPMRLGLGAGMHSTTLLLALESDATLAEPYARAVARVGLGLDPRKRRDRAEHEKQAMERARREASAKGERAPGLHEGLVSQTRDPKQLPVSRCFSMDGPLPDLSMGCATIARGELAATGELTPEELANTLAARTRKLRAPARPEMTERRDDRPARGGPPRRDDRPDRDDRRGPRRDDRDDRRGPRRDDREDRRPKGPPPPKLPDRPATDDEIKKLLERFGRR